MTFFVPRPEDDLGRARQRFADADQRACQNLHRLRGLGAPAFGRRRAPTAVELTDAARALDVVAAVEVIRTGSTVSVPAAEQAILLLNATVALLLIMCPYQDVAEMFYRRADELAVPD